MPGTIHLDLLETSLYDLAQDEMWDGSVEAPSGAFVHLDLNADDAQRLAASTGIAAGNLPAHVIIREDSQGFLHFLTYAAHEADTARRALEDLSLEWTATGGEL